MKMTYSWASREMFLLISNLAFLMAAGASCGEIKASETKSSIHSSVSVYALSRGKGVPDEARQVLEHARQMLKVEQEKGEVNRVVDQRIGLEGETRVCAEFQDDDIAERFFEALHRLSNGVDLLNVKKEACPP